jgi:hypothetical protein
MNFAKEWKDPFVNSPTKNGHPKYGPHFLRLFSTPLVMAQVMVV